MLMVECYLIEKKILHSGKLLLKKITIKLLIAKMSISPRFSLSRLKNYRGLLIEVFI